MHVIYLGIAHYQDDKLKNAQPITPLKVHLPRAFALNQYTVSIRRVGSLLIRFNSTI